MYVPGVLDIILVHGGLVALLQPTRAAWGPLPAPAALWVTWSCPGLRDPCSSRA